MEITKEIYAAHQKLSDCSVKFLDFVKDNPESLKRSHFNALLNDSRFDYFKSQPWPTFINNETKKEIEEASVKLCQLIKSIPGRLFSFDLHKISSYYEIPEDMTRLLMHGVDNNHLDHLLNRADFIFLPSAGLKCIEFNMQANFGGWELDLLEPLYMNTPIIAKFLKDYNIRVCKNRFFSHLFKYLVKSFLDKHPSQGEVNMAIAFPEYGGIIGSPMVTHLQRLYKKVLQQASHSLSGDFAICGFDVLDVNDDFLFMAGKRIDILIEMNNGKVPFMFLEAVKNGNLLLSNGPVTRLMSNKLNLALLSQYENSDIFSQMEREAIKKYIPWTRKVVPDLEDFMLSNREQLVLKSAEGLGGDEVFPGRSTLPVEWAQQIEKALEAKNWVVQEYIPTASYLYQMGEYGCAEHHAVWGFFVFGARCAGGFVRILPGKGNRGVINSHQGAEESIILEVDES